jgi:hypothetical protein
MTRQQILEAATVHYLRDKRLLLDSFANDPVGQKLVKTMLDSGAVRQFNISAFVHGVAWMQEQFKQAVQDG